MPIAPKFATLKPGRLFLGGEWQESVSGATSPDVNPATGAKLVDVAKADRADIDRAVAAARKAFDEGPWRKKMSASDRGKALLKIAEGIRKRADELAELESLDKGKPIREAKGQVWLTAECFEYYAGWCTKLGGETIPVSGNFLNYTLREPVGVVAAIVPWNFALLIAAWKVAPALAAGNTVILKPASETPLSALALGEIAHEAGLPPGVLNVITGPGSSVGMALVEHAGVDKVSFTGSTEVGKAIQRAAAATVKRVTLELGGKSPNIVLADADLEAAVKGAQLGIFFNQGEVCSAGSRILVEEKVHDEFVARFADAAQKLAAGQGDPLDPNTRLGSQVSEGQLKSILAYCEKGKAEGAKLVAGGERSKIAGFENGAFLKPTIFDDVSPDHTIAREEIFGPVAAVIRGNDVDDVVEKANRTIYGLASAIWTRDVKKAHAIARRLRAGTVWINCYNVFDAASPFGGFKQSGFGRDLGAAALEGFTEVKSVWVDLSPYTP